MLDDNPNESAFITTTEANSANNNSTSRSTQDTKWLTVTVSVVVLISLGVVALVVVAAVALIKCRYVHWHNIYRQNNRQYVCDLLCENLAQSARKTWYRSILYL